MISSMKSPIYYWRKILLYIVVLPAVPFVIGACVLLVIANYPDDFSEFKLPTLASSTEHVIIFAHGKSATPDIWEHALDAPLSTISTSGAAEIFIPNWNHWSNSFLKVSLNGYLLGKLFGQHLAKANTGTLTGMHVAGHSAGAFFAYGVCEGAKEVDPGLKIQTTYIAPLSIYRGLFLNYGTNHFGDCADFSDTYIHGMDPTPGANLPVLHSHSFDLTKSTKYREHQNITPHAFPLYYYAKSFLRGTVPRLTQQTDLERLFPANKITTVN